MYNQVSDLYKYIKVPKPWQIPETVGKGNDLPDPEEVLRNEE